MAPVHRVLFLFLLLIGTLLWIQTPPARAGKILVYPIDGSHWVNMDAILRQLHGRGHHLTVVRSSNSRYVPDRAPHYHALTVSLGRSSRLEEPDLMAAFLKRNLNLRRGGGSILSFAALQLEMMDMLAEEHRTSAEMVRTILTDEGTLMKLREAEYDLVLTDPGFGGGVILGTVLRLPMVFNVRWITSSEGHQAIAPSPLSYVPTVGSHLGDRMTFTDRLRNLLHFTIGLYIDHALARPPYQDVIDEFLEPSANINSLIQGADLWLMRVDFVFEFPRPTTPNVVYVGGFQCRPSRPLPADLEKFVQSSGEHGVVVMSLGTLLDSLGPELSEIFAAAFGRLPQKVVWRLKGAAPTSLSNNTLVVDWLPQNDLLGHPKTRVFVTHGGTNGIYEALYHGVPMLGIPLLFDQFDNMVRLKERGVTEVLDVSALDVDTLTRALLDVLDDARGYGRNVRRLSRLHRDTPMKPMDSAIFWLEYVMRHKGASHLRTESYRLSWVAYHNVDVLALFLGGVVFGFLILVLLVKFLFRLSRAGRKV